MKLKLTTHLCPLPCGILQSEILIYYTQQQQKELQEAKVESLAEYYFSDTAA